jgi:hypothetical protein
MLCGPVDASRMGVVESWWKQEVESAFKTRATNITYGHKAPIKAPVYSPRQVRALPEDMGEMKTINLGKGFLRMH